MSDHFVKEFDREQHRLLRRLYGDLVPPIEMIFVRPGLYGLVDSLFAQLGRLPDRRDLRVARVETRNAAWLEIVTTGGALGAGEIIADIEEAARHTCEHCGKPAHMIVKVGLEAALSSSEFEAGDRLLCFECATNFREELSHEG